MISVLESWTWVSLGFGFKASVLLKEKRLHKFIFADLNDVLTRNTLYFL